MSRTKLKNLTSKIGSGATPTGGKSSYIDDGISLIRSLNVYDYTFEYKDLAHITELQAKKLDGVEILAGDILINITGASVGRCCMVPTNVLPARVNQHVSIIRANPSQVNARYLLHYINDPNNKRSLLNIAQGGATREAITKEMLEALEVELPSRIVQGRIASILSAYDDLIENNARRITILEAMAQRLYREWFVHFRFLGHEKTKMVESELGPIPNGWNVCPISDNIKPKRNTIRRNELSDDMLYVGIEHIPRKKMVVSDCSTASEVKSDKLLFSSGDVLFGKIRAYFHKIAIAPFDGCCSTDVIVFCLSQKRYAFDYLTLFSDDFIAFASQISQGTKMPRAEWNVLKDYNCVSPPQPLIEQFNQLVCPIIAQMQLLTKKNANLRRTRDLLLPRLISGDVDVSELEIKAA